MKHEPTWIARALEGTLSEAERAEFRHRLIHDPAFQEEWARHAWLHGLLGPMMEDAASQKARMAACVETAMREDQVGFIQAVDHKIRRIHFRHRAMWAAAAVFLIGILGLWHMSTPTAIATVVGVHAAHGIAKGNKFSQGDKLRITSGLVELDLAGHGRMIVEGPAEVTWNHPLGAGLASGRVFLTINKKGHGYRLDTPQGSIIDLGTAFGVVIDPATGKVETHVMEGEVEARPGAEGEPVRLRKDEALRFSARENERIATNPGAFYRTLPLPRTRDLGMIHWSMDIVEESTVVPRTHNLGNESAVLQLNNGPKPVEGPFGSALQFDGNRTSAESHYRGIVGSDPRTVAFWLKAPKNLQPREHYAIVGWGKYSEHPGSAWQIALNHDARVGTAGALRLGVKGHMAIGTTDLRDDQWHHVAVVLHPPTTPEASQQAMIFIDGEMEPLSNRSLGTIDTSADTALHGVRLGHLIDGSSARWRHFRGAIDEVYIFDDVLAQEEIRTLMERNQPPVSVVD